MYSYFLQACCSRASYPSHYMLFSLRRHSSWNIFLLISIPFLNEWLFFLFLASSQSSCSLGNAPAVSFAFCFVLCFALLFLQLLVLKNSHVSDFIREKKKRNKNGVKLIGVLDLSSPLQLQHQLQLLYAFLIRSCCVHCWFVGCVIQYFFRVHFLVRDISYSRRTIDLHKILDQSIQSKTTRHDWNKKGHRNRVHVDLPEETWRGTPYWHIPQQENNPTRPDASSKGDMEWQICTIHTLLATPIAVGTFIPHSFVHGEKN